MKDEHDLFLVHVTGVKARQFVPIVRTGELLFRMPATVWEDFNYGLLPKQVAAENILKSAEELAESFANSFLRAQEMTISAETNAEKSVQSD